MAITNQTNTEKTQKDYWRTPPELINDALRLLNIKGFDTDVCCASGNEKIKFASAYIDEQANALTSELWFLGCQNGSTSFCNPPFSKKWEFFEKAVEQSKKWSKQILIVLPYTPTTKQWHQNVHDKDCIIYVPDGRYNYLLPDGSKPSKKCCNFETCLILVVPFKCGNIIINYKRGSNGKIKLADN